MSSGETESAPNAKPEAAWTDSNEKPTELKKEVDSLLKNVFNEFCKSTSAHGFQKLAQQEDNEKFPYRRVAWLTLILAAFLGFAIHLTLLVVRYLNYPTNTETIESSIPFKFPDVTFCPNARFAWGKLKDFQNMTFVPGTNKTSAYNFVIVSNRFWLSAYGGQKNSEDYRLYSRMSYREVIPITKPYKEPHDVIFGCKYRGDDCSFLNFTIVWHPSFFLCYTFKPNIRDIQTAGQNGGLQVYLGSWDLGFSQTDEEKIDYTRGYTIAIHPQDTTPNFDTNSVTASVGNFVEIELTLAETQTLNRPIANCIEGDKEAVYYVPSAGRANITETYEYTLADCKVAETQELFVEECGCLTESLRVPYHLRHHQGCHVLPGKYYYNSLNDWIYNSTYKVYQFLAPANASVEGKKTFVNVSEPEMLVKANCEHALRSRLLKEKRKSACKTRCQYLTYSKTVGRKAWPQSTSYARPFLDASVKSTTDMAKTMNLFTYSGEFYYKTAKSYTVSSSFNKVVIFAAEPEGILQKEQYVYPLSNLFSDLMGILGFWAGTSIITLCELMEIIASLVYRSEKKRRERNRVQAKEVVEIWQKRVTDKAKEVEVSVQEVETDLKALEQTF